MIRILLILSLVIGVKNGAAQFCLDGKRLTPENYLIKYQKMRRHIVDRVKDDSLDVIDVLSSCDDEDCRAETCLHNRFLFNDFILYFDLESKYSRYSSLKDEAFELRLMQIRDSLYFAWTESMSFGVQTGYFEWESADLNGESLEAFLDRDSERFAWLERIVKLVNGKPSKRNSARLHVYKFLQARTPFSSIMPIQGMSLAADASTLELIDCTWSSLNSESELWSQTLGCTNNDKEKALLILGVLSAQRMYLIRDFKAWMDQNLDKSEFDKQYSILAKSSCMYFNIETRALAGSQNYPEGVDGVSPKSYHFYTTALLAYELAKAGFDFETSIREATRPAKKYKRAIILPGLVHNIWLRNRLGASTVGDYKQVVREQKKGAEWGWRLYSIQNN